MNKIIMPLVFIVIEFFLLLTETNSQVEVKVASKHQAITNQIFNKNFIISNVNVYDGFEFQSNVSVQIKDNEIFKIAKTIEDPSGVSTLDALGKTLIPGLIDSHTHTYGRALVDAINFGVTTELDMFTLPQFATDKIKNRDNLDNILEADLFSSTILVTTKKGHGTEYGFDIPVLENVEQVDEFVKDRISDGADYIKAVYDSEKSTKKFFPSISIEILGSLIQSAHKNNKMLVVHVDNLISAKEAVSLGADGIVHSFMDHIVDEEFIQMMRANNSFIIPTLSVQAGIAQLLNADDLIQNDNLSKYLSKQQKAQLKASFPNFGIPESAFQNALDSVSKLSKAGITIISGTDAPNPGTSHGVSLHGELLYLIKAGLTHEKALHSATGAVSKHFPVGSRGTLKIGAMASMLLLEGNPIEDISHTQNITHIWKNGIQYIRNAHDKSINTNKVIEAGLITDFNSSINKTTYGRGIIETTDQMAGGKSTVDLSLVDRNENNQALMVKGEVKSGFVFAWSGISFIPALDQSQAVDMSQIKSLNFDLKAAINTAELSILLFEKGNFQPKEVKLELSNSWQSYQIYLADFINAELTEISNISFVVNQKLGKFEFLIDNIEIK
jgi:imidazolonepropionase-like amidohydrolase